MLAACGGLLRESAASRQRFLLTGLLGFGRRIGTEAWNYQLFPSVQATQADSAYNNTWVNQQGATLDDVDDIVLTTRVRQMGTFSIELDPFLETDPTCSVGSACDLPSGIAQRAGPEGGELRGRSEDPTPSPEPGLPAAPIMSLALSRASPNPARTGTVVLLEVPAGDAGGVLEVYDVAGRRVRRLWGSVEAGRHEVSWDLRREQGSRVAAGVYFIRFSTEGVGMTRKVVVLE